MSKARTIDHSLTVIIPTLTNTAGLLHELQSLTRYRVIVIDNAPAPAKRRACGRHPQCLYLPQTTNLGFARAINLASSYVKTDWIVILNDDIEFFGNPPFKELITIAKQKGWEAVSPLLTKKTGDIENLGYRVLPLGRTELVFDTTTRLDGLTAACLVMKTQTFRQLEGFDSRFFAYLEDLDLFLRLQQSGYQFGVATDIKVIHNHMTTSGKMNNFKAKMDLKNWIFVIAKNWSLQDVVRNLPGILVERLRNLSGFAKATWKSYGWRSLYILPRDILWILRELSIFPFNNAK